MEPGFNLRVSIIFVLCNSNLSLKIVFAVKYDTVIIFDVLIFNIIIFDVIIFNIII